MLSAPPLGLPAGELNRWTTQGLAWLAENRGQVAAQVAGEAGIVAELFAGLALAVFCALFFLHSGERLWGWVLGQLPVRRARWDAAGRAGWTAFAGYTRGVVLVAVSNATFVGIALHLLKVPLALPLSLLVLFGAFVPLIGAPIAMWIATLVALAGRGPLTALAVLVLIVVIGQIEGHVLHPLIMSRAVKLHPVVVAVSVASGTVLAGIIGAVVAVPMVAVAWATFAQLRATNADDPSPDPRTPDPREADPPPPGTPTTPARGALNGVSSPGTGRPRCCAHPPGDGLGAVAVDHVADARGDVRDRVGDRPARACPGERRRGTSTGSSASARARACRAGRCCPRC